MLKTLMWQHLTGLIYNVPFLISLLINKWFQIPNAIANAIVSRFRK